MSYFKNFPLLEYKIGDGEWLLMRDVFIRLRILDSLQDNPSFLTTVTLNGDERPDVIAHKLYKNSNLHWTLYLVNDIIDPSDWLLSTTALEKFISEKYENPHATVRQERDGVEADYRAARMMVERNPFKTVDSLPDPSLTDAKEYYAVSAYEHETALNDSKRVIRAIRPNYMNAFLLDVERKLRSITDE